MGQRYSKGALLPQPPLLITESASEFAALCEEFEQEFKPRGIIERTYVSDICSMTWEIWRIRRCKTTIINAAFRKALSEILLQAFGGYLTPGAEQKAEALAKRWFTDQEAKKQVSNLLAKSQLDETAIEAKAIQMSSSDLELIDKMLASLEARRTKAWHCIAEYRVALAQQLRRSSDRIIEGKDVLRLEDGSNKPSEAA
jgi:hypothetical protein